jgi:hypothetical protein
MVGIRRDLKESENYEESEDLGTPLEKSRERTRDEEARLGTGPVRKATSGGCLDDTDFDPAGAPRFQGRWRIGSAVRLSSKPWCGLKYQ